MLQTIIDNLAEGYLLLDNNDKRMKLNALKHAEERAVNVFWVIFVITICIAGFCGWLLFIGDGHGAALPIDRSDEAIFIFFPICLFIETAWARSTVKTMPIYVMLATSVAAMLMSAFFVFVYLVVYSIYFMIVEVKLIGMKILPGYPLFEDIKTNDDYANITYDSLFAENKIGAVKEQDCIKTDMDDVVIPADFYMEGGVTDNAGEDNRETF